MCHSSPLPVISTPPLTLYSFSFSLVSLSKFYEISIHWRLGFDSILSWPAAQALSRLWRTIEEARSPAVKWVPSSMNGKVAVYKKESLYWTVAEICEWPGCLILCRLNWVKISGNVHQRPTHPPDFLSIPPPVPGLAHASALEVLGVSFSDCLDFSEHFHVVCSRSIYALKVLKDHGLLGDNLWQVCRANTITKECFRYIGWSRFGSSYDKM